MTTLPIVTPPSESSANPLTPDGAAGGSSGASTPSLVDQQRVALSVEWSKLSERLAQLKADEQAIATGRANAIQFAAESRAKVVAERKAVVAEMERTRRLIGAHDRVRTTRKRKP
jgi:hypothetical protein